MPTHASSKIKGSSLKQFSSDLGLGLGLELGVLKSLYNSKNCPIQLVADSGRKTIRHRYNWNNGPGILKVHQAVLNTLATAQA